MNFGLNLALVFCLSAVAASADPVKMSALNQLRAAHGKQPVIYSKTLEAAALRHARDMATTGRFSHVGTDGSDVAERVSDTGYGWCVVAENIAYGQIDLAEVIQAWADSPGHRRNMLSSDVQEFAVVQVPHLTWVMVLAKPGC